jgi:Abnormal spindle-like microcephaly-assoc'd, ASPM-SPD-2-Hydin
LEQPRARVHASAASLCFYSSIGGAGTDVLGHLYIADSGNNRVLEFDTPLNAVILAPIANLSGPSLNFGNQLLGTTSSGQTVAVSNVGNSPLNITSIAIVGANAGDFAQTNNCGSSVEAGSSCQIRATFAPAAVGTRSGKLKITDNNNGVSGSTQTVSLSGTGSDFTINASPAYQTISCGHAPFYRLTLTSVNGFADTVSLTCGGGPPNSTCTIIPNSVTLNGSVVVSSNVSLATPKSASHGTFAVQFTATSEGTGRGPPRSA